MGRVVSRVSVEARLQTNSFTITLIKKRDASGLTGGAGSCSRNENLLCSLPPLLVCSTALDVVLDARRHTRVGGIKSAVDSESCTCCRGRGDPPRGPPAADSTTTAAAEMMMAKVDAKRTGVTAWGSRLSVDFGRRHGAKFLSRHEDVVVSRHPVVRRRGSVATAGSLPARRGHRRGVDTSRNARPRGARSAVRRDVRIQPSMCRGTKIATGRHPPLRGASTGRGSRGRTAAHRRQRRRRGGRDEFLSRVAHDCNTQPSTALNYLTKGVSLVGYSSAARAVSPHVARALAKTDDLRESLSTLRSRVAPLLSENVWNRISMPYAHLRLGRLCEEFRRRERSEDRE